MNQTSETCSFTYTLHY